MATELDIAAIKICLLFQGLPFNLRENNVEIDDDYEIDLVLVGNSTESENVVTLGNNVTQLTRENVAPQNVPHNLENIPIGHESNNFVMNRGLAEDFLHSHSDVEENRRNLGQESDEVLDLPERQSNSSNTSADNVAQNDDNTSETEIVDSLQGDRNLNDATVADADDDDNSSETDDEFDDDNSDLNSDDSDDDNPNETDDEFDDNNSYHCKTKSCLGLT